MLTKEQMFQELNEKTFNPMNDVAFKFIFGKEERKNITLDFLDAFLYGRLDHHITDITYKNTELVPLAEDGKLTRLDVRCDLSSGEQVDVEVQVLNLKNMRRRTLYYWAQMYLFSLAGADVPGHETGANHQHSGLRTAAAESAAGHVHDHESGDGR